MTRENQQDGVTALKKYPTGISAFEEITDHEMPGGRPELVCGNTGGGKTLFAAVCILLMLFNAAIAYSQSPATVEGNDSVNHPLLFLGK